jgi:hypothetical protein
MRNNNTSANGYQRHRRLFIRNFLTDFRRQSSVNDYQLANTLVCVIDMFLLQKFV